MTAVSFRVVGVSGGGAITEEERKEMVLYFLSNVVSPPALLYMGEDKYENEELLKWGFPEDVWFHVDKMSSAHVYLRRPKNMAMEEIPEDLITDCAQLVKANSIVGCKTNNIAVVYTEFGNLKKTARMDIGQVGFHDDKKVLTVKVEKKLNDVVNRLNKTKEQRKPNLQEEREERDREERAEKKKREEEKRRQEKEEIERKRKEAEQRSYSSIMQDDHMKTNEFSEDVDYRTVEDDFM